METELEENGSMDYTNSIDSKQKLAVKKWEELDITDDYILCKWRKNQRRKNGNVL